MFRTSFSKSRLLGMASCLPLPFFFFAARRPRRYGCPCSYFFGVFLFFFLLLLLLVGAACSTPGCGWKQKQKRPSSIHRLIVRGVARSVRYQLSWRPRQFLNLASTGLIVVVVFLLVEWCEWYVFDKRRYMLRQLLVGPYLVYCCRIAGISGNSSIHPLVPSAP